MRVRVNGPIRVTLLSIVIIIGLVILGVSAYRAGQTSNQHSFSCSPNHLLGSLSVTVVTDDKQMTTTRTLRLGTCRGLSQSSLRAAVSDLTATTALVSTSQVQAVARPCDAKSDDRSATSSPTPADSDEPCDQHNDSDEEP